MRLFIIAMTAGRASNRAIIIVSRRSASQSRTKIAQIF
jgi:hypothetical protein